MNLEKKLIIYTHGGGRFTNQLFCYAHLIAFLAENNYCYDMINLAFWPYTHLLEKTSDDIICTFPTKHEQWKHLERTRYFLNIFPKKVSNSGRIRNNIIRLLYAYGSISSDIQSIIAQDVSGLKYVIGKIIDKLDLEHPDCVKLLNQSQITLLAGWKVRGWSLLKKHQNIIKNNLSLKSEYIDIATNFIGILRQKYDFLVGVLIRQDDYRIWVKGKYFFETQQYINWIKQAKDVFEVFSSKVGFVIASNEPQDYEQFKNLNVYFATGMAGGKGHYLESMAELSQCDLIMTPPSTFGAWAAFLGNIPILPLCDPAQIISNQDLLYNNIFDSVFHPDMSQSVK